MLLSPALSLAARPRCFGCRSPGAWACPGCVALLAAPVEAGPLPGVDRILTPWAYEGLARDLVLALKLRARRPAAEPLARVLAGSLHHEGTPATAITWVPGRPNQSRRRGFDHAEAIAIELAGLTGLPLVASLSRVGDPPDQTTLSREERRRNLGGAFVASGPPAELILVDDLVTTGATAEACCRSLRDAGATYVEVLAPCRA